MEAARQRADEKHRKYGVTCRRVDADFRDAVMERYGACHDVPSPWEKRTITFPAPHGGMAEVASSGA